MVKINESMIAKVSVDTYTEGDIVEAFNLWMDTFSNNPSEFDDDVISAHRHLQEKLNKQDLSYGESATATLMNYIKKNKLKQTEIK
jgi:hypothetical protein